MKAITGTIALALLAAVVGCSASHEDTQGDIDRDNPTLAIEQNLNALAAGKCLINTTTKDLQITIDDNVTAVVSLKPDKSLVVNGYNCYDSVATTTQVTFDGSTLKTMTATGTANNNGLIIDYSGGAFATAANAITVDLKAGTDTFAFRGTTGNDTVVMGTTGVKLGTAANLTFTSKPANIVFMLGAGADTFNGGGDSTTGSAITTVAYANGVVVYGGAGNDTFVQGAAITQGESIFGGTGTDTVDYSLRTAILTVALDGTATDGDQTAVAGTADENDNIHGDIEVLNGGSAADTLDASGQTLAECEGGITINGNAGNDTITGSGIVSITVSGNAVRTKDKLNGGAGDDTFLSTGTGEDGDDAIDGGAGVDTVSYATRTGTGVTLDMAKNGGLTGGSEVDTFVTAIENAVGSTVTDVITGTALANIITGGNGADTLNGLAGADIFYQGATADGADTIDGGADVDTLDYSGRSLATTCSLATGTGCGDVVATEGDVVVINSTTTFATVENLWGAKASGTPVNTLTGDGNDNEIVGGPGADVLAGGAGNDTIQLNAIPTSVDCGTGDDSFIKNGFVFGGAVSCDVVFP